MAHIGLKRRRNGNSENNGRHFRFSNYRCYARNILCEWCISQVQIYSTTALWYEWKWDRSTLLDTQNTQSKSAKLHFVKQIPFAKTKHSRGMGKFLFKLKLFRFPASNVLSSPEIFCSEMQFSFSQNALYCVPRYFVQIHKFILIHI